jgi:uncharacterized DUF497 family protein
MDSGGQVAIKFTWDPRKAKRNLRRHKLSFKTGKQVFDDPFVVIVEDCEDDQTGETRYHAIGRAGSQALLVVTFADRSTDGQDEIHIISVRKAEAYEEGTYSDQF